MTDEHHELIADGGRPADSESSVIQSDKVYQQCVDCGHSIRAAIENCPIACQIPSQDTGGDCDGYCNYVVRANGRWLVDPQEVFDDE